MGKITLEAIAKTIGVSKVSVYNALNDKKGVSEALRVKIKNHAKSLGYINKQSLIEAKNKKFLFFINQDFFLTPSEQYYSTIFYFISAECNKNNSILQIAFIETENTIEKMKEVIAFFKPDGLFIVGEINTSIFKFTESINIPTVFIDYYNPLFDSNFVYVDNYHLSYMISNYLIAKGHKNIGFVGNINKTASIADRYFGYLKALTAAKFPINNQWHININLEKNEETGDIVSTLPGELPTAFICHCDAAAQRLYTILALKGLKVPDDISIISFDNTPLCDNLMPKLTSAGPQKDYYAKKAFNLMIECLNNKNKVFQKQIQTDLVERESVKYIKE
ncbi:MAG: LacI family DNA-binding transcriptional regulator [Bacilli bacterium]|nr:LacI family DNA-binding transcriptional regulator [Bacilli bacterium]